MGVAGPFFERHPPNLVRIHFLLSCKNAEIFVVISQVVSDLAKISVSVLSIVILAEKLGPPLVTQIAQFLKSLQNLVV